MGIYGNPNAREPFSHFQKCELGIEDTKEKRMTAKKSKYKHVQIKKKKYFFYQITWDDITGDAGHATKEEFDKFKPSVMITHAYIYKKDKKYVWTFLVTKMEMNYFLTEI